MLGGFDINEIEKVVWLSFATQKLLTTDYKYPNMATLKVCVSVGKKRITSASAKVYKL